MKNKKINEFYNLLLKDLGNTNDLEKKLSKISSEEELEDFIDFEIIPVSKEKGFDFTKEDLLNYEKEVLSKLSEEELLNVSGGVSPTNIKLLSLLLAGVSLSSNVQSTHAMISRNEVMRSTGIIRNMQRDQQRDPSNERGLSRDQVIGSQTQQNESMTSAEDVDMQYMLDALNLLDPYIFNFTGTTENFRFLDGYKQKISTQTRFVTDGIPGWDYNKDKGKGSPNFMRCLFPSTSGVLSTEGGYLYGFTKDCDPTPELIAQIVGYIHNYIRAEDELATKEFDALVTKVDGKKKLNKATISGARKFLTEKLKITKLPEFIGTVQEKVEKETKYIKTILYLLKNAQIMIVEQESDSDGEDPGRILPKYIPERMLMSYFIQHFNDDKKEGVPSSVDRFYTEAKRVINKSLPTDQSEIERSKERLEKVANVLERIGTKKNSPYQNKPQAHGDARRIIRVDNGKVKFLNKCFPDCADIAARHVMNLLMYNPEDRWKFVLGNVDKNLDEECNSILYQIDSGNEIDFKPLKERLELFFYYQANHPQGADAVDKNTRSFWNYVISNMNGNVEDGMYELTYKQGNYELKAGHLNMLKSIYNMVFALKCKDDNFKGKLGEAKAQIDNLSSAIQEQETGKELEDALKLAIGSTFKLINENLNVEKDICFSGDITNKDGDCFCTVDTGSFTIYQSQGHASVDFNPIFLDKLDSSFEDFLENDSVVQLLSNMFDCNVMRYEKVSMFNHAFCLHKSRYGNCDPEFSNNFSALWFLRMIQGEGSNKNRILNLIDKGIISSNIKVADGKLKEEKLVPLFIFKNYITTVGQFEKLLPDQNLRKVFEGYECEQNGMKFYYEINNNEEVTIYPLIDESVTNLSIPSNVTIKGKDYKVSGIGKFSFKNNKTLKSIKLEEGIKNLTIGSGAFYCSSIEEITIPESVENLTIGNEAFNGTKSFKEFKILSDKVKGLEIWECAFAESGISSFTVPKSVERLTIGSEAFNGAGPFKEFKILSDKVRKLEIGECAFAASGISSFTVPKSVERLTIGNEAFNGAEEFKEFKILSDKVKELEIGEFAFEESGILSFIVPESIEGLTIEGGAFFRTDSLEKFEILSDKVKELEIEESAFELSSISSFTVPVGVEKLTVKDRAFYSTESLKKFEILSDKVIELEIGKRAFDESSIPSFTVSANLEKLIICESAFESARSLEEFKVFGNIKELEIGKMAFWVSDIKSFIVSGSVEKLSIGNFAFGETKPQFEVENKKSKEELYL